MICATTHKLNYQLNAIICAGSKHWTQNQIEQINSTLSGLVNAKNDLALVKLHVPFDPKLNPLVKPIILLPYNPPIYPGSLTKNHSSNDPTLDFYK